MAVNPPRESQGRVERDPMTAYDAPTRQVHAVDEPRDADVNVWHRPQAPLLRERVHWHHLIEIALAAIEKDRGMETGDG